MRRSEGGEVFLLVVLFVVFCGVLVVGFGLRLGRESIRWSAFWCMALAWLGDCSGFGSCLRILHLWGYWH